VRTHIKLGLQDVTPLSSDDERGRFQSLNKLKDRLVLLGTKNEDNIVIYMKSISL